MRIHFIIHESYESPAAIEEWANNKGYNLTYTHLYQGEVLPPDSSGFDFLIVMGGPQSPATTIVECSYFDAAKEIALIQCARKHNKIILGVCLGAQLMGVAFGATFEHSPHKEIGVFEIELTAEGKEDPIFSSFPERFLVGHWHGDMPGLTANAKVLATSAGCPRQIVRYAPRVYGLQCHFEFNQTAIKTMVANSQAELAACDHLPFVQSAMEMLNHDYSKMNKLLFNFLDHLVSIPSSDASL